VKIGLRTIVLLGAVVLFLIAIFVDKDQVKWLAAGLAAFAGAFVLGDLPGGGRLGGRR
jgi:hypothetical protein